MQAHICEHMEYTCQYLCFGAHPFIIATAAAAVTSWGEMTYGMHSCPTFRQLLCDVDLISRAGQVHFWESLVCGLGIGTWVESDHVSQVQECKNIPGKGPLINNTASESTRQKYLYSSDNGPCGKTIPSHRFFGPRILTIDPISGCKYTSDIRT